MNLVLRGKQLSWNSSFLPFLYGKGGLSATKQEGDGATPLGIFPFRRVFYRPDRLERPVTSLPLQALTPKDGWCDDPKDQEYNRFVTRPHPSHHECLWREDELYDLILVVGHNDAPVEKGKGSAIFVHLISPSKTYTAGCVALYRQDLLKVVREATPASCLIVEE